MAKFDLIDPEATEPAGMTELLERRPPKGLHDLRASAPLYKIDPKLADSINVALALGAPLLVTGEPGTGKTQLAYYLAWYFGIEADVPLEKRRQPFDLAIKSTTTYRDLLYRFDAVAYFREARVAKGEGKGDEVDKRKFVSPGPLWLAIDEANAGRPAIVLLDEIDKAPRDFPNDLLRELDQFELVVEDTGQRVARKRDVPPPIVVVTSNSEKQLPPAFLRRCVFHHIELDNTLVTRAIVSWRETRGGSAEAVVTARGDAGRPREDEPGLTKLEAAAVQAFWRVREIAGMEKVPATAELLGWLTALVARGTEVKELDVRLGQLPLLSVLVKDREDLERVRAT